ncbi:MAG TPA: DNA-3-methyladenine glycosylase [Gammaproteobacteria bacterium]|nr:DNA-3-methyladenine glycosylase [Gammaproteobacteria bacterium]
MATHLPFDTRRAVRHLRRMDSRLAELISRVGPLRMNLRPAGTPFEALLRAITYQQLSGKAAATIHSRLLDLFPEGLVPERLLAIPETALRGAGLSRNKVLAVRDLAIRTLDGGVPDFAVLEHMSDDEVIERLTVVRGIGRWSVEMLLIFTLGRPDVLPVDDLGIRKGFQLVYGMKRLPAAVTLRRAARVWSPYRSAASWYLWRATDTLTP